MTEVSPQEATERVEELADAGQTVVAAVRTGETDARDFYAVVREWPHPEEPGTRILCIQNAQIVAEWSDMSDTWLTGSYRQRVPEDNGAVARALAKSLAATAAQQDAGALGERDPEIHDATQGHE